MEGQQIEDFGGAAICRAMVRSWLSNRSTPASVTYMRSLATDPQGPAESQPVAEGGGVLHRLESGARQDAIAAVEDDRAVG